MPDLTVFISYRRADSSADAGRLYDALRRRFGRENLFMDVDSLRPGEDWVVAVEGAVTRCDVLLAIIGPDWAGAADGDGNRRLNKELDRVRLEIEAALRHDKPVIPVLVEGASMPSSEDLPETLRPLLRRHAIRVSHSTFESDLGALVRALRIIDRSTHGRSTARPADEAEGGPLVVTPAPEPALPAPPPTAQIPPPSSPASAPNAPIPAPPPPAAPPMYGTPQPGPPQPTYTPPSVVPAYAYTQPAYPYNLPATRKGPSSVLIGAVALGLVLIIGVGAMYALHVGPFADTAQASPSPTPTAIPTQVPTLALPTASPSPLPTVPPTLTVPTLSPPPPTASLTPQFARLWAAVPIAMQNLCQQADFETPTLNCYVTELGTSFFYSSSSDLDTLRQEYKGWLSYWHVPDAVADCFQVPIPVPCEQGYNRPGVIGAGRVVVLPDGASAGRMYWTHEPALIFGEAYILDINAEISFQDVFNYWAANASVLNVAP